MCDKNHTKWLLSGLVKTKLKKIALILFLFATLVVHGAHLVGGELSYSCAGNNNYTVTLKVYRDCNSAGAPFDPNAIIAIFKGSTLLQFTTLNPAPSSITNIPVVVANPCLQSPPNICTEMATYTATVNLPPTPGGYILTYQRCCRNATITNIPNPGTWGSTYTTRIPSNDVSCNSSPRFTSNPPIVLCTSDALNINSSAIEPDGDSLYYEFCSPLHGGSQAFPSPGSQTTPPSPPVSPPPYALVPFSPGFSASNPITSNPTVQINPSTGLITGKPTQAGQYVVAICVSEYRNGVLLSTVRRDYQFNVTVCQSNVTARMNVDTLYCTGKTVSFANNSLNGTSYFWDFGDPLATADTSNAQSPTYTFKDTGSYNITLIVNKGWPCSDTLVKKISVRLPAHAEYSFNGPLCLESGLIAFTPVGQNPASDKFTWNFGSNATPSSSSDRFPPPVNFSTPGKHPVLLTVNSYGCVASFYDTVKIYLVPEIGFNIPQKTGCAPFTVAFIDSSIATSSIYYEWDFGDGTFSADANPVHTYQTPGVYSVNLVIYTTEGCIDTLELNRPNFITVNPTPTSAVTITPTKTNIYNALVEVTDLQAKAGENFYTDMDDGTVYTNTKNFLHQYQDTGTYIVKHVVSNGFNCADTTLSVVRINPEPLIFAPSAFTPNGDGNNDIYLPSIVGSIEYELIIYSRWGDMVFRTTNPHEGWNGTNQNSGPELPVGVYTYTIHVRDLNFEVADKKGYITLYR